jgi:uncharacterized protein YacL
MLFFRRENRFVLDSSSIMDGRVVHLFEKKIFEGRVIIPTLVRTIVRKYSGASGERAIKILRRNVPVDFIQERGNGLVEETCVLKVARKRRAKVFTVSDEVCRQAKFYPQVSIIDIRDMYRVLTPIFVPNKLISVRVLKRGLNHSEGVGYKEGVKIVVENGAKFVNQTVTARVTTMLAFETGNLVFCTVEEKTDNKPTAHAKEGKVHG